jgi:predicted amidohydrolase
MELLPIALIQASVLRKSPEANQEALLAEVVRSGENGAKLVILPELWNVSFPGGPPAFPPGVERTSIAPFCKAARRFGMGIVAGSMAVRCGEGTVNRCHVIGPDGKVLLEYDKIHASPFDFETGTFIPGSTLGMCAIFGWRIGILICFDMEFPEQCRSLVEKGSELLVVVGAWPADHVRIWKTLLAARSMENQVFTVGVNRCDCSSFVRFGGHSLAVDPFGETLLQLDDRPRTELVWLRKSNVEKARKSHAVWSSRRGELYRKWR